jgi:PAS domain S-box-containing protein
LLKPAELSVQPAEEVVELKASLAAALRRAERAEELLAARDSNRPSPFMQLAAEEVERSERLMRAIFASSSDALLLVDSEGRYVDANPAASKIFGIPRNALLRERLGVLTGDAEASRGAFRELLEKGQSHGRVTIHQESGAKLIEYTGVANVREGLHLLVLRDVTAEQATVASLARTEAELRRSDARFRAMVEKSGEAIVLFASDGRVLYGTPRSSEILGFDPGALIDTSAFALIHHDDHERVLSAIAQLVSRGSVNVDFRVRRADGTERWLEATATNMLDDPDVGALVANIHDVTEEREAELERELLIESLRFERSRLGSLLAKAPAFIAVFRGPTHVFELANDSYRAMVGDRPLVGRTFAEALPEFVGQGFNRMLDQVLETGESIERRGLEAIVLKPSGAETHFVNVMLQALVEADGRRSGVFVHGVDVTEETAAQRRNRAQFNGIPVPTYAWQRIEVDGGKDFVLFDFNEAAATISDGAIEAFRGRRARDVFSSDPDVLEDLHRCIDTGAVFSRELERPMKSSGRPRRFLVTYAPAPPDVVLAHAEDVTERKQLEDQLRQAQKMEAIGRLAGGVAHDFNNMLSVILSYTRLMLDDLSPEHPMVADLGEVQLAADRAVDLTRLLLAFSRQQVLQPRMMSLNESLAGVEKMLRRLVGEDVELTLAARSQWKVRADRSQIEQVIMNLVINARDAMPEGGKLVVETDDVDVVEPLVTGPARTAPGSYVRLTVRDTGVGMDEGTQARIFEPFFTTKAIGTGTGLGLSTVFGIVQQSQGAIHVQSKVGAGSSFQIYLPRVQGSSDRNPAVKLPQALGGDETILVVEDEDALRKLVVMILHRAGYRVLEAADGEAALRIAEDHPGRIDLLLSDVVMPRASGRALSEKLSQQRKGVQTLFMSGYTDDASVLRQVLESKAAFLQKPVTPDNLLRKVREVLDAHVSVDATR